MDRPGDACSNGLLGACLREGKLECQADRSLRCTATAVSGSAELCDGVDNDCDGAIDEGVLNPCGGCAALPSYGLSCSNGQLGACLRFGLQACREAGSTACNAPFMKRGNEGASADGKDNDCDGMVDEPGGDDVFGGGFLNVDPMPCPDGSTGPC